MKLMPGYKNNSPLGLQLNDTQFTFGLVFIYFSLSLIGIYYHEVWLDEAHSFLIARDSTSFTDLLHNIRAEGHPWLWYLVLWILNKVTQEVFYMQLLHIVISTFNAFLLIRFAPFERLKKILFVFSYYIFYEYNIISRNYGLCLLMTTLFCILICKEDRKYMWIAFVLFILSNTHFIGLLLAIALGATTIILMYNDPNVTKKTFLVFGVILLAGFISCIVQIWFAHVPSILQVESPGLFSPKRFAAFTTILKSLYQFPQLNDRIWNTNVFTQNKFVGFFLTIVSLIVIFKSFINKPISLFIILLSSLFICSFFYSLVMDNYTVRHWGFLFLAFYVAVWISEGLDQGLYLDRAIEYKFLSMDYRSHGWRNILVYSVLSVQMLASILHFVTDLHTPFSNSKNVADYIFKNQYNKDLIIVSNSTTGPSVSAYLGKKIYYPECKQFGSFSLWNSFPNIISREKLLEEVSSFKKAGYKRGILVVYNHMFDLNKSENIVLDNESMKIKYLQNFNGAMVKHENFELFLITYK